MRNGKIMCEDISNFEDAFPVKEPKKPFCNRHFHAPLGRPSHVITMIKILQFTICKSEFGLGQTRDDNWRKKHSRRFHEQLACPKTFDEPGDLANRRVVEVLLHAFRSLRILREAASKINGFPEKTTVSNHASSNFSLHK